jgi:hypothetical protein
MKKAETAPRLDDYVIMHHAACGGAVTGELGGVLRCAECGAIMEAFGGCVVLRLNIYLYCRPASQEEQRMLPISEADVHGPASDFGGKAGPSAALLR